MKCPKCQSENREGVKFCEECGTKMELACPGCGARILAGKKFFGECGYDLKTRKEPTPINYSQPQKYEGTINQFTGDGVMALFGAPVSHEDHAQRACYAALSIQKALGAYGDKIEKDTGVAFKMRIGLNSGPVIVGAIGDDLRMDYTAVGDTTNLGSRMESLARPGTVLLSKHTRRLVKDYFDLRSLGQMEVKGKKELQEAFELIKASKGITRIGASVAKGLTRFVGRKNSTAALLNAFDKVKSGAGQVVGL